MKDASGPSDSLSKVARLEEVVDEEEYGQQSGIGQEGCSTREEGGGCVEGTVAVV